MPQLSDIAREAKVSVSTVSLALRNLPQIPAATRERVQAAAKEFGYQPNPLVSAYQANVRSGRAQKYRGTIAWIDDTPAQFGQERNAAYSAMQQGARKRAEEQGFTLDIIAVPDIDRKNVAQAQSRLERIMGARGITGGIFPELWWARLLSCEWKSFAVAAYGGNAGFVEKNDRSGLGLLRYTNVGPDVYHDTRLALAHLRDLGYRRIALITSTYQETGAGFRFTAARHAFSSEFPEMPLLKVWVEGRDASPEPPKGFRTWLRATRPDAVLTTLACARDWLAACNLDAPRDIGLAHPFLRHHEEGWSGVRENYFLMGSALTDAVIAQILRGERGVPAYPKALAIAGHWEDGVTTRLLRKSGSKENFRQ